MTRRLCLSLAAGTVAEARRAAAAAPREVELVELRLDRLLPEAWRGTDWESLPGDGGREWVATWRSPAEGGAAPRPAGILARAREAGFHWIDVEAEALEAGDAEARAVPEAARWVSLHLAAPPRDAAGVAAAWARVNAHPGALAKLVVPAGTFEVNTWTLDLLRAVGGERDASIFALGWPGHVSRVAGYLEGNAVTFLAPDGMEATAPGQPTVSRALDVYGLAGRGAGDALYGVVGASVRHSGSPALHNAWFRDHGCRAVYVPLETASVEPVLAWLRSGRLAGCSVTMPFKETVMESLDHLDASALRVGAVNTIVRGPDGTLRGANTDHAAAAWFLATFPSGPVGLVGAGGAARAVAAAAREAGRAVSVFNRSPERGQRLAEAVGAAWAGAPGALDPAAFAVLVNATPLGIEAPLPEAWARPGAGPRGILDLAYGSEASGLEQLASKRGVPFHGGRAFLTRQAAEQFALWTGIQTVPGASAGGTS